MELLDSRDFNQNINNRNTRGVAIRRRDAAIELTELADEYSKNQLINCIKICFAVISDTKPHSVVYHHAPAIAITLV